MVRRICCLQVSTLRSHDSHRVVTGVGVAKVPSLHDKSPQYKLHITVVSISLLGLVEVLN